MMGVWLGGFGICVGLLILFGLIRILWVQLSKGCYLFMDN